MKKVISLCLLFSLNATAIGNNRITEWSAESSCKVALWTALSAAVPGGIAYYCRGDIDSTASKVIVGFWAAMGGFFGYAISSGYIPEGRFNHAIDFLNSQLNKGRLELLMNVESASEVYEKFDILFVDNRYPRAQAMITIEDLQSELNSSISSLAYAITVEAERYEPNTYLIEEGKQCIDLAQQYLAKIKLLMPALKQDQTYLLQRAAYSAEIAAREARDAAFQASQANLNSLLLAQRR